MSYRPAADLAHRFREQRVVARIWERDISVWGATAGSADARSIATRLGWLDVARTMPPELGRVMQVAEAAREEHVKVVYLLGMGGSSLCAEVMRSTFGVAGGYPQLTVMDTTDEFEITSAAATLDPAHTWFIVASKSGGTVEVASLERYFRAHVSAALGARAGRQFVAVTDPGTALNELAVSNGYREIFLNPPDIGGRFSALSLFGLVPDALIGSSPGSLLEAGAAMAAGCRQEHPTNPGLELGAFIGAAALEGRDKLTVVLPRSISALGLWIEQLVAESTGKHGKGALPVVDASLGEPDEYGSDRAFVAMSTDRDEPDAARLEALEKAGFPMLRLSTRIEALGAEFFRWEFATAIAGAALGINPFDEPNVSEAKEKTRALLSAYSENGALPEPPASASSPEFDVATTSFKGATPPAIVRAALASIRPRDYVAFLSYVPGNARIEPAVANVRARLRKQFKAATTFGVGPRYLHSTGQYHKGGPNQTVAFILIADDRTRTPIPEAGSFSVLRRAQALGDAETLAAHGRRAVLVRYKGDIARASSALERLFDEALSS